MRYKLFVEKRARKFLKDLQKEKKQYVQIAEKLLDLSENPLPPDAKKIKGEEKTFLRVDVGEFYIVYRKSARKPFALAKG